MGTTRTILKYKVIQAQRVWNESRYSLVSLRSAVNCKSIKIGGLRRISFEMQGAHAETKRSMPEHVSIGFRGGNAAGRRKDKQYTILLKSLILAQDERWRRA